jgi:hypothetical protein
VNGGKKQPYSNASSYLELQHTQIDEVNSEYEVTQADGGRASISPGTRPQGPGEETKGD